MKPSREVNPHGQAYLRELEEGREPLDLVQDVRRRCREILEGASDRVALKDAWYKVLGRKGCWTGLREVLKAPLPGDRKRVLGKAINELKAELTELHAELERMLPEASGASSGPVEDITLPGRRGPVGALHPLTRVEREVVQVLASLGFEVAEGPEIEDEFHNFIALNIPEHHPARDESENFYLNDGHLLRSQTSTIQIRVMEGGEPPFRIAAPGRVFRPDTVDATHHFMFHQVEGLVVDRDITMADLKHTLVIFFKALLGEDVEIRMRPSFFPFTEPSAEVDVHFPDRGWVETGGCGMVDPAVFRAVGIDPEEWSGFAFGLGLERLAMRQFGVPDIRYFTENDARFLRQVD